MVWLGCGRMLLTDVILGPLPPPAAAATFTLKLPLLSTRLKSLTARNRRPVDEAVIVPLLPISVNPAGKSASEVGLALDEKPASRAPNGADARGAPAETGGNFLPPVVGAVPTGSATLVKY